MLGLLPPSSSETFFRPSAQSFMICLPVEVSPVNAILSTPGWVTRAFPTLPPGPGTTLNTPSGKPAAATTSANLSAVSGVRLGGLWTIVQPVARAGPYFHIDSSSGKFHGVMAPTTPTGSFSVKRNALGREGIVSPVAFVAQPA